MKPDPTTYLKIARRTVTVQGPLGRRQFGGVSGLANRWAGKLDLVIPPFIHVDHDESARQVALTIEDNTIKHQKAMWGQFGWPSTGGTT